MWTALSLTTRSRRTTRPEPKRVAPAQPRAAISSDPERSPSDPALLDAFGESALSVNRDHGVVAPAFAQQQVFAEKQISGGDGPLNFPNAHIVE